MKKTIFSIILMLFLINLVNAVDIGQSNINDTGVLIQQPILTSSGNIVNYNNITNITQYITQNITYQNTNGSVIYHYSNGTLSFTIEKIAGTTSTFPVVMRNMDGNAFSMFKNVSGLDIMLNFSSSTIGQDFNTIILGYKTTAYNISNTRTLIQIWDYTSLSWVNISSLYPYTSYTIVTFPVYNASKYLLREARLRFYNPDSGSTNNTLSIDWLVLSQNLGTATSENDPYSIHTDAINTSYFNYFNNRLQLILPICNSTQKVTTSQGILICDNDLLGSSSSSSSNVTFNNSNIVYKNNSNTFEKDQTFNKSILTGENITLGTSLYFPSILIGLLLGNPRGQYSINIQTIIDDYSKVAKGLGSIAIGTNNRASKDGSSAIGTNNKIDSYFSYAYGNSNIAYSNSNNSDISGSFNECLGSSCSIHGNNNTINADFSSIIGNLNEVNNESADGSFNTFGVSILGNLNNATGIGATAVGVQNTVKGLVSTAIGYNNYCAISNIDTIMCLGNSLTPQESGDTDIGVTGDDFKTTIKGNGMIQIRGGGMSNKVTCWMDDGITLGHCVDLPFLDGSCTCEDYIP